MQSAVTSLSGRHRNVGPAHRRLVERACTPPPALLVYGRRAGFRVGRCGGKSPYSCVETLRALPYVCQGQTRTTCAERKRIFRERTGVICPA